MLSVSALLSRVARDNILPFFVLGSTYGGSNAGGESALPEFGETASFPFHNAHFTGGKFGIAIFGALMRAF